MRVVNDLRSDVYGHVTLVQVSDPAKLPQGGGEGALIAFRVEPRPDPQSSAAIFLIIEPYHGTLEPPAAALDPQMGEGRGDELHRIKGDELQGVAGITSCFYLKRKRLISLFALIERS
jgi:hypothetical protein